MTTSRDIKQVGGVTVDKGIGPAGQGTQRVAIADNEVLVVSGLNLAPGAATSANQLIVIDKLTQEILSGIRILTPTTVIQGNSTGAPWIVSGTLVTQPQVTTVIQGNSTGAPWIVSGTLTASIGTVAISSFPTKQLSSGLYTTGALAANSNSSTFNFSAGMPIQFLGITSSIATVADIDYSSDAGTRFWRGTNIIFSSLDSDFSTIVEAPTGANAFRVHNASTTRGGASGVGFTIQELSAKNVV